MTTYHSLRDQHTLVFLKLKKQSKQISIVRLLLAITFLVCGYFYLKSDDLLLLAPLLISFIGFIILMRKHQSITRAITVQETLITINTDEINYLENNELPFDDGINYNDYTHSYSHDLDIFGTNSLYQNLNRTATYIGKTKLAGLLLSLLPNPTIKANQKAIKELAQKVNWRQKLLAYAKITNDNKSTYDNLIHWATTQREKPSKAIAVLSYLSPILFLVSVVLFIYTEEGFFGNTTTFLFIANLSILGSQKKKIQREIFDSGKIYETLKHYSLIIEQIENEEFDSERINQLKDKLKYKSDTASTQIKELSKLFSDMDSIHNLIGVIVFNGFLLYHVHILRKLLLWKEEHANEIVNWLEVIGEIESLNSLANFSYNNPEFTFPELNKNYEIDFKDLGHPLISAQSRVNNTVDFNSQQFIILTGSNMSGKSTFLRTLGINMVLTGIGAPICATSANVHPLQILVSMRLSDSLNDSESYFFAEVKRLKEIMTVLENKRCFVLLDEILRGTNSDDKQTGTIEVIKKIIAKNTIGAIATHDLEVCLTTNDYPDQLTNKCFEVEIINNDLEFDYKLRDGICKNKSATFLMQKMEIF